MVQPSIIQSQITNVRNKIQCDIENVYTILDEICIHFCNKLHHIIPFLTSVAETLEKIILLENNVSCFAIETAPFFLTLMARRQTVG
jgi:hypothetical protein